MNGESHGDHHPGNVSRYTAITRVAIAQWPRSNRGTQSMVGA